MSKLADGKGCRVVDRSLEHIVDGARQALRLDERKGAGLARFDNFELADGVIEFDVRGKNVPRKSFVGVAFRGTSENTYDAVYFRPFNFRSDDPVRRGHAVRYVSHPDYPWERLRTEHPNVYENTLQHAPDPDAWFHVRIVLAGPRSPTSCQLVARMDNGARDPRQAGSSSD